LPGGRSAGLAASNPLAFDQPTKLQLLGVGGLRFDWPLQEMTSRFLWRETQIWKTSVQRNR
jgi:hypothetical protein